MANETARWAAIEPGARLLTVVHRLVRLGFLRALPTFAAFVAMEIAARPHAVIARKAGGGAWRSARGAGANAELLTAVHIAKAPSHFGTLAWLRLRAEATASGAIVMSDRTALTFTTISGCGPR